MTRQPTLRQREQVRRIGAGREGVVSAAIGGSAVVTKSLVNKITMIGALRLVTMRETTLAP